MPAPTLTFKYRSAQQEFPFIVQAPYCEGHLMTRGEAQALNQLRAERIRENCRPTFSTAADSAPSGIPDTAMLQLIQQKITRYDEGFQFAEKHESRAQAPAISAIEREALELARGEAPDGSTEEEIATLASSIDLLAAATERVRIRAEIARSGIDSL